MVKLSNISIGHTQALYSIEHYQLEKGKVYSIIGINGSGKSTLLQSIADLVPPIKGEIELAKDSRLLYMPAKPVVHPQLRVDQAVLLGLSEKKNWWQSYSADDFALVNEQLKTYQIDHLSHRYINELSDGQQQKVWMAQAALSPANVLLLDEPSGHLDPTQSAWIFVTMHEWAKKENKCVIFASHKLDLSLQIADEILYIKGNSIAYFSAADEGIRNKLSQDFSNEQISYNLSKPNQLLCLEKDG